MGMSGLLIVGYSHLFTCAAMQHNQTVRVGLLFGQIRVADLFIFEFAEIYTIQYPDKKAKHPYQKLSCGQRLIHHGDAPRTCPVYSSSASCVHIHSV